MEPQCKSISIWFLKNISFYNFKSYFIYEKLTYSHFKGKPQETNKLTLTHHSTNNKNEKKKSTIGNRKQSCFFFYIYIFLFNLRKQRFKITHRSSKVLCLINIIDFLWNRSWAQILAFFSFSFSFSFSFFLIFFII